MRLTLPISLLLFFTPFGVPPGRGAACCAPLALPGAGATQDARNAGARNVVDRIVAIVEGDVIALSEVRELGAFNLLTGQAQLDDSDLLQRLINQWIVATEAAGARFPVTPTGQVERAYVQLVGEFPSPEAFLVRLRELGLDEAAVRRQLERQLFLARYLDQKYRFLVRLDDAAVETYYRETLSPQLSARGQTSPQLDTVRDQIREVLTQQEVTRMAERWLEESRSRLRIDLRTGGPRP